MNFLLRSSNCGSAFGYASPVRSGRFRRFFSCTPWACRWWPGGSAAIDLVLLGFWPKTPVKPLERLFPLIWWGFWINAVTGPFC